MPSGTSKQKYSSSSQRRAISEADALIPENMVRRSHSCSCSVFSKSLSKSLLVTIQQSLMNGGLGIYFCQRVMMISASGYVAQCGDVMEPAQVGDNVCEASPREFFDNALVLGKTFEGFHQVLH